MLQLLVVECMYQPLSLPYPVGMCCTYEEFTLFLSLLLGLLMEWRQHVTVGLNCVSACFNKHWHSSDSDSFWHFSHGQLLKGWPWSTDGQFPSSLKIFENISLGPFFFPWQMAVVNRWPVSFFSLNLFILDINRYKARNWSNHSLCTIFLKLNKKINF